MAWRCWLLGALILGLGLHSAFKVQQIQRLKAEIVRVEAELSRGQEVWKNYPPLTAVEKRRLQEAQERLLRTLPDDKDIPPLLQDISGLVMEHKLVDVSINTGDKTAPSGAAPPAAAGGRPRSAPLDPAGKQDGPGAIESMPLKVTFAGDYRDIAYFLDALGKLPRLVIIQSMKVQRALPLQQAELILHAYYQKAEARP